MGRTICSVSDELLAAKALGGRFEREDCGYFEQCSHRVERYDASVAGKETALELYYCAIDWTKVGPLVALLVLFLAFAAYRLFKRSRRRR